MTGGIVSPLGSSGVPTSGIGADGLPATAPSPAPVGAPIGTSAPAPAVPPVPPVGGVNREYTPGAFGPTSGLRKKAPEEKLVSQGNIQNKAALDSLAKKGDPNMDDINKNAMKTPGGAPSGAPLPGAAPIPAGPLPGASGAGAPPTGAPVGMPVGAPSGAPVGNPPTMPPVKSESTLYRAIPSVKQINKMTREELITLKKYLINHCLKEALESNDVGNIKLFATSILKKWQKIPFMVDKFYSDFINDDLNATYNKIIDFSTNSDTDNPVLSNLNSTVKSSLDQTMKLITQSSDWIGIILSKSLNDWNNLFSRNKFGSLTIGKFLSISALCASVVYIMTKLFKTGFNKESTLSECEDLFSRLYYKRSAYFKEGLEEKLQEYINKEVPSNVITLNSLINNAYPLAMGLLYTIGYNGDEVSQTIPTNILVLTEICASIVILWKELIGKKFKGLCKGKSMISSNLLMKMNNAISGPTDVFNNLNDFKNETTPINDLGGESNFE